MALELVPLTSTKHANLKLLPNPGFSHVKKEHIAPILVQEFARAATEYPIVFVKRGDSEALQPVVILGLKPGENLYCGDGIWEGLYIPASITHHPLALVPSSQNPDEMLVAILEGSTLTSEEEGEALFEDGKATEFLEKRKTAMQSQFEMANITAAFTKTLQDLDLFDQRSLNLELNGEKITINGLYMIDEQKLMALPAKKAEDLNKRGMLAAAYAHLSSLHQVHRMAKRRADIEAKKTEAASA
ncbi:SapC family protein [Paraferrimonas haliotis]|uniref:SapC family protein n=1 Tax=Paraferrimonas haliotis TaxID=2013866 RepID=A0AA37WZQ7_9GAMM|nr:SapC family protein [Paraferrimonas haliotis]GLS84051.1 SapC family protein [Paraferrimonas haliotis]